MSSGRSPEGMSGGPIIPDSEEWKYYSVGIIKGEASNPLAINPSYGVRITQYLIDLISDNINQYSQ